MDRHQIRCIYKSNSIIPSERIRSIGGLNPNGTRWQITQQRAIEGIEQGKWSFYVVLQSTQIDIVVASHDGMKYIKGKYDISMPDSLLGLPECP